MVLSSSFPSSLQRAFTHRRKKNFDENDENTNSKVSIDQTVSTREDCQQINAMADVYHSSFDLDFVAPPGRARTDALIGDAMYNSGYSYRGRESMIHSHSDPSFSAQYTAVGQSSYVARRAQVPQHQQRSTQSFQGMGMDMRSPQHPSHPPPMVPPPSYYSYGVPRDDKVNVDPTLQARIEAVKIQEQLLGFAHPDVIFALAGIAKLYEKRGDHAQAANIMKESQMRSIMAKSAPQGNLNRSSPEVEDVPIEISFPR